MFPPRRRSTGVPLTGDDGYVHTALTPLCVPEVAMQSCRTSNKSGRATDSWHRRSERASAVCTCSSRSSVGARDHLPRDRGVSFFPGGAASHTKKQPNQFLDTPSFRAQKGLFKAPLTFLGLAVCIQQILNFADIPGMSTSSIMPFHNVDPKLVHRLPQGQQIWPRKLFFVD